MTRPDITTRPRTRSTERPIVVDGLEKRYGETVAVSALDLEVRENEIYGLLGPNGAGKSTLLNVLAGSVRPDAGEARLFGADPIADTADVHRRVGTLPDRYGVYETLSAVDHVRYALEARGADGEPLALLERVGLGSVGSKPAGSFSKGMQQRLVLAIALAGSPDVLLLDEPFSGLDPVGVRRVFDVVHERRREGATVLLSSHDVARVKRLCDRIGIVVGGRVRVEGTPMQVLERCPIDAVLEICLEAPVTNATVSSLSRIDGVDVTGSDRRLSVQVRSAGAREAVERRLASLDVGVDSVVASEPTLEDAFVQYVAGTTATETRSTGGG
ncbi:ABC transporter ATP-binding protein [Salinilacihabitans rarus]|uniref:ABC transporter ATP-binding protein n=1 Tax=Salinilacihabitans rarus TaxID=2961596 RepID=UPI0020C90498|nr:ABC transporter ATP-binding protein [Salinilacihabitans rarus]